MENDTSRVMMMKCESEERLEGQRCERRKFKLPLVLYLSCWFQVSLVYRNINHREHDLLFLKLSPLNQRRLILQDFIIIDFELNEDFRLIMITIGAEPINITSRNHRRFSNFVPSQLSASKYPAFCTTLTASDRY